MWQHKCVRAHNSAVMWLPEQTPKFRSYCHVYQAVKTPEIYVSMENAKCSSFSGGRNTRREGKPSAYSSWEDENKPGWELTLGTVPDPLTSHWQPQHLKQEGNPESIGAGDWIKKLQDCWWAPVSVVCHLPPGHLRVSFMSFEPLGHSFRESSLVNFHRQPIHSFWRNIQNLEGKVNG